jgi:cellulose synthase operon protein C
MLKKLALFLVFALGFVHTQAQFLKKLESSDELYKEAKKDIEVKQYQTAITLCNKALDISPHNLDIHLLLGRAYALVGKIDSARDEFSYVIRKDPKYHDAYIYSVNMEAAVCNYSQALEDADLGLKYYPNDRDLLLRKMDIYEKQGNWTESNRIAEYLFEVYPDDKYIRDVYIDYKKTLARYYARRGSLELSQKAYQAVLEQSPKDVEAMQALYNVNVRSGDYGGSLALVNRALQNSPDNYDLLIKKVGILESMGRYTDAIEVVNKLMKLYSGNPDVQKLNIYIRMEAGRFYMNLDPYMLFLSVLDRQPSNREALNYVINLASSRGYFTEALHWVNVALKYYPGDGEFLNKKVGILENLKDYVPASDYAEQIWKHNRTDENKATFLELRTLGGKQFLQNEEYDSAIYALKSVLYYDNQNLLAYNYLISAYEGQKNYDEAIRTIDSALAYYPNDEGLIFKKAGVLEAYGHNTEAAQITKSLLQKHPDNLEYLSAFVDESLAAGRNSMQYNDYENTINILKDVLDKQPNNIDALNYIINVEDAVHQYDSAIYYCDLALAYYKDSKDFMFKKSSVYADEKMYREAYTISGDLYRQFPYNNRYRDAYVDQVIGSGRQYLANDKTEAAQNEFYKALAASPYDTSALYYTINLLVDKKNYDTAMVYIRRGRNVYPGNPFFLRQEAQVFEGQKDYHNAWLAMDTLVKMYPLDTRYTDYFRFLYSLTLHNAIGFYYLHASFDYSPLSTNIASLFYQRTYKLGSTTFRVDYAGRPEGTGFQFAVEDYLKHGPVWYSYFMLTYSPPGSVVFPTFRAGYSLFHNFKHSWDGEIGFRYLNTDSIQATHTPSAVIYAPTAAVGKEWKDFYFNLRGYYLNLNDNSYWSTLLTSRYYLNNRTAFFTAIAGYGTAPDDFTLNYETTRLTAFNTVTVGAGYQWQVSYRTTLGIYGTWYNERVRPALYHDEYDLFFVLIRRF